MIGRVFDGFRIEEQIGRGGMGVVYRATQLSLNRAVAIKVLPESFADDVQFLDRFHREVDVLSRLSHPNIVTVIERGEVDGKPYVVMEFVAGTSLRRVLANGPLPRDEALGIVRNVLAALDHAHGAGIVHRDIKPENVLLAPGGIVKVADFGLSRLLLEGEDTTRLTKTHIALGTYEYMSPEQRERAKEADERSDLYAAGVVLYEMIAGELPIGHFEPLSRKCPGECDSRVDAVVEKSLKKEPDSRYQSAGEMGDAVSQLLTAAPVAPDEPEPGRKRHRKRGKRHEDDSRRWVPLGIIAVLGGVAVTQGAPTVIVGTVVAIAGLVVYALPHLHHALKVVIWVLLACFGLMFPVAMLLSPVAVEHMSDEFAGDWREVGRIQGTLPEGFEREHLLQDVDVQIWINEVCPGGDFPDGVEIRRVQGRLEVRLDEDVWHYDWTMRRVAAAIGYALERRAGPAFKRTISARPHDETKFENRPFPAQRADMKAELVEDGEIR